MWEAIYRPEDLPQALEILHQAGGAARVIAGGTDLVLQIQRQEKTARYLVDIGALQGMGAISLEGDMFHIGAAVTHAEIAESDLLRRYAHVLSAACGIIGSPQVRNSATIGGNIVNAQPAADSALALIALGAEAEIMATGSSCWKPVADLFLSPGSSFVDSTKEILVRFRFASQKGMAGSAYRRLGKCKSIALPVLCAAAAVSLGEDGDHFIEGRIALGPVAPTPLYLSEASEFLKGEPVADETIDHLVQKASRAAHPRESLLRCSVEYRERMVAVLIKDVVMQAVNNARQAVHR